MKKETKETNKIIRRNKTKEITKTVLSICAAGGLTLLVSGGVRTPDKAKKLFSAFGKYSIGRVNECLKRLSMQNYIKYDVKDLTKPIFITKKGLERLSFLSFKDKIASLSTKKWDHLWRLVTFDVSENYRKRRDTFRRRLIFLNFYQLQKNIFVTPFSVEEEVEELAKQCRLYNRVLVLHVASLGKFEEEIRKYFFKK